MGWSRGIRSAGSCQRAHLSGPRRLGLVSRSDTQAALDVSASVQTKSSSRGKPSARKAYTNDSGALLCACDPQSNSCDAPCYFETVKFVALGLARRNRGSGKSVRTPGLVRVRRAPGTAENAGLRPAASRRFRASPRTVHGSPPSRRREIRNGDGSARHRSVGGCSERLAPAKLKR